MKNHFQDIDKYEELPEKYISELHVWFSDDDATKERKLWHRTLKVLLDLHTR